MNLDVGNMSNEQVYPLRELGKRALYLQLSFLKPEVAAQLEAAGQTGFSLDDDDDEDEDQKELGLDEAGRSSTAKPGSPGHVVRENTLATLDATLVVIGEVFGQRDLLEFRQPWTVGAEPS